jgi:hypothetical protein
MGEEVRYERRGAAAVLTIDRPERRNAVDGATARALRQGFDAFESDDAARVLVLTGVGGEAFCAGADLKALDLDVDGPAGPMGFSRLAASPPRSRRSPRSTVGAWRAGSSSPSGAICASPRRPRPSGSSSVAGECRWSTAARSGCRAWSGWAARST